MTAVEQQLHTGCLLSTFSCSTAPSAVRRTPWYCLHTKSRREKRVADACARGAMPYFLPLRKSVRRHDGRSYVFHVPLFPGYMFCAADVEQRRDLLCTNHLASAIEIVDRKGLLADLRKIVLALEREAELAPFPYIKRGVRARIVRGPFRGVEGIVSERRGKFRVALNVTLIRQAVAFEVGADQIEPT